jgi:hypothetical protein
MLVRLINTPRGWGVARRVFLMIVAVVLLVLGMSGGALAENYFPPIYNDYAADRDLDGTYTFGELWAYLNNAEVAQYGDPAIVSDLYLVVWRILSNRQNSLPLRHATPREIYDDYAEDGDFDWNYYSADLQAYLDDALIHQYSDPAVDSWINLFIERYLSTSDDDGETDEFPLTGAPLALLILGFAGLAGAGLGLHRLAHSLP